MRRRLGIAAELQQGSGPVAPRIDQSSDHRVGFLQPSSPTLRRKGCRAHTGPGGAGRSTNICSEARMTLVRAEVNP
jgi:hypothetical protein